MAHHHLWDLGTGHYPWLQEEYDGSGFFLGPYAGICRNYDVADLRHDQAPLRIAASIHIEAERDRSDQLGETWWLEQVHAAEGLPSAVVAHVGFRQSDRDEVLRAHLSSPLVRGIRSKPVTSRRPDESVRGQPGTLDDPKVLEGLAAFEAAGLSWDLRVPFWHLAEAAAALAPFSRPHRDREPLRAPARPVRGRPGHLARRPRGPGPASQDLPQAVGVRLGRRWLRSRRYGPHRARRRRRLRAVPRHVRQQPPRQQPGRPATRDRGRPCSRGSAPPSPSCCASSSPKPRAVPTGSKIKKPEVTPWIPRCPCTGIPSTTLAERAYGKATARIVPILIAAFLAAYLDRVNVGFAKLQMASDLKLSDAVYGVGAGVFFFGYFLFELPSNLILHRVGARTWLARIMVTWGIISGATMLVHTEWQFYGMRFALGAAEAGFMPGVIYYLSSWFPAQRRGRVVGLFFIGLGVAGFIGGPVSGLILKTMPGVWGLAGWQWLFLLESIPSIAVGVLLFVALEDRVDQAKWLTPEEKAMIAADLEEERRDKPSLSLGQALCHPLLILMTCIFFICNLCLYGLNFWLPTLIVNMGVKDPFMVGLMSALPSLCAIVSMVLVSRSSDLRRERRWHLAGLYLTGAVGLGLSVVFGHQPVLGLLSLCIATAGILAIPPLFWNLPTAVLSGVAAAGGLAVLNSFANLSGFFGPAIVGWAATATGGTEPAILFLAGTLVLAAGLIFVIPARLVNK